MKKWFLALVMIAMLATLYSCDEEMIANPAPDSGGKTKVGDEADPAADTASADATTGIDVNKIETTIFEDRVVFLAKTSPEVQTAIVDSINTLFRSLPDTLHKYLMVAPMRIAFEVPVLQELSFDQKEEIRDIYMAVDSSVTLIDAYYALEQHAGTIDELNDIFYRTDHHWTHLGSYYAAQAFLEAAGLPYHTIDEYEVHDGGNFLGYLANKANDPIINSNPDSLIYYLLPDTNPVTWVYNKSVETGELVKTETVLVDEARNGYEEFIGTSGFSHVIIFGDETSDRSLLMVGNSYANSIATWLADSFHTVILIDPRYFEDGKDGLEALINDYAVTDALVMISTSESALLTENFSDCITLLTQ